MKSAVLLHEKSYNRKLSPVLLEGPPTGRSMMRRPHALGPFCSATSASIQGSYPDSCRFKREANGTSHGCFADAGLTRVRGKKLDAGARGLTAEEVVAEEAAAIRSAFRGGPVPQDGARGGRDLRIHVMGDAPTIACAELLAEAAADWWLRGGGATWSYTHAWRDVPRAAWGAVSVLASVEDARDVPAARAQGYMAALVVPRFPSERKFFARGHAFVPCPAETRERTCVECRLCFDDGRLRQIGVGIAFALHGSAKVKAAEALRQRRLPIVGQVAA